MNCGEAWHGSMLPGSSLCSCATRHQPVFSQGAIPTSASGEGQAFAQCLLSKEDFLPPFQVLAQISPPYYSASRSPLLIGSPHLDALRVTSKQSLQSAHNFQEQ